MRWNTRWRRETATFQSAPDREVGRCSISPMRTISCRRFQSAPDREVGRCSTPEAIDCENCSFNPRPTVRSGDASIRRGDASLTELFQSAPDREVGRCTSATWRTWAFSPFQSAPDREVGRCRRRAAGRPSTPCFNPRPTVRSGDACQRQSLRTSLPVSIRARP